MQQYESTGMGRSGAASTAAGQTKELARASTQQIKDLGSTTKERALRELDTRRESLAGEIEKLAGTLENQQGESDAAGPVLQMAASAARRLSSTMKDHSSEELFQKIARNPAAMLAGTFALGFLVTRLMKE